MSQRRVDPRTADYDGSVIADLSNAIYLRIMTPLGSYWPDKDFGSRLHELEREKDVARVEILGKQYTRQALQPLLDDGRADRIEVVSERQPNRLALHTRVYAADGSFVSLTRFVKVH